MINSFLSRLVILAIAIMILSGSAVQSQNLNSAIQLYEQGDYERALQLFEQYNTDEAYLYAGKSAFALNLFIRALDLLAQVSPDSDNDMYADARYTRALSLFQLGEFTGSLELMKELSEEQNLHSRSASALRFYDQLLGYLTPEQRRNAFMTTRSDEIRYDLIESALGRMYYPELRSMYRIFSNNVPDFDRLEISRLETVLRDSASYVSRYPNLLGYTAPDGISYTLGILLPEFQFDSPEYEIPQHLYYGIQLAIEQFNGEQSGQKVFLSFRSTSNDSVDALSNITDLLWNDQVDVLIGPLFSEVASRYAEIAERYAIPMVLPLANADSLDLYNDYVFQLNPPFTAQGKKMAAYAVETLGYDTLGVIAESGSLGSPAARSFLREAEKRGAFVRYYFEEDLASFGYDITDYTRYFTTDTTDSVDMVQAVYAPFTGAVAPTLTESMLTDLEAMRSTVDILGSEEWASADIESRRLKDTRLFYTTTFETDTSRAAVKDFQSLFRLRFGTEPSEFAYIGFDVANVVLDVLKRVQNPALFRNALKDLQGFRGLTITVDFDGGHQNTATGIGSANITDENDPGIMLNNRRR